MLSAIIPYHHPPDPLILVLQLQLLIQLPIQLQLSTLTLTLLLTLDMTLTRNISAELICTTFPSLPSFHLPIFHLSYSHHVPSHLLTVYLLHVHTNRPDRTELSRTDSESSCTIISSTRSSQLADPPFGSFRLLSAHSLARFLLFVFVCLVVRGPHVHMFYEMDDRMNE